MLTLLNVQGVVSRLITVTPDVAKEWIQNNKHPLQRKVRPARVSEFARAMKEGRWKLNGESLIFSKNGNILTGQHRLLACIEANIPFTTIVTFGVEDDTFTSIGNNIPKSNADMANESGYFKNQDQLMSSAGVLYSYEHGDVSIGTGGIKNGSKLERLDVVGRHPGLQNSVSVACSGNLKYSKTAMSLIHYLGSRLYPEKTEKFLEQVNLGVDLEADSPAYLLRERILVRNTAALRRELHGRSGYRFAIAIKAFNLHLKGETLKNLVFNPSKEQFPVIYGDDLWGSRKEQDGTAEAGTTIN